MDIRTVNTLSEMTDTELENTHFITLADWQHDTPLAELASRNGVVLDTLAAECIRCNRLDMPVSINTLPSTSCHIGVIPTAALYARALPKQKIQSYLAYLFRLFLQENPEQHLTFVIALPQTGTKLEYSINEIIDDLLRYSQKHIDEAIIVGGRANTYYNPELAIADKSIVDYLINNTHFSRFRK